MGEVTTALIIGFAFSIIFFSISFAMAPSSFDSHATHYDDLNEITSLPVYLFSQETPDSVKVKIPDQHTCKPEIKDK